MGFYYLEADALCWG